MMEPRFEPTFAGAPTKGYFALSVIFGWLVQKNCEPKLHGMASWIKPG